MPSVAAVTATLSTVIRCGIGRDGAAAITDGALNTVVITAAVTI